MMQHFGISNIEDDKTFTKSCLNFAIEEVEKDVNLIDLVLSFPTDSWLRKIGVDTAENEPLKVRFIFKLRHGAAVRYS